MGELRRQAQHAQRRGLHRARTRAAPTAASASRSARRPQGVDVDGVELEFRDGEVVGAARRAPATSTSSARSRPTAARASSASSGIGTNFGIDRPTGTILFDEKIGGTVHLALGRSYPETGGKNASALHWDLICDLRAGRAADRRRRRAHARRALRARLSLRLFVTGLGGYLGHAIAAARSDGARDRGDGALDARAARDARVRGSTSATRPRSARALDEARPDAVIHTAYVQGGEESSARSTSTARRRSRAPPRPAACGSCTSPRDVIFTGDLGRADARGRPARADDGLRGDEGGGRGGRRRGGPRRRPRAHEPHLRRRRAVQPRAARARPGDDGSTTTRSAARSSRADLAAAVVELAGLPDVRGPLQRRGRRRREPPRRSPASSSLRAAATRTRSAAARTRRGGRATARSTCARARALLRTRLRGVREVLA